MKRISVYIISFLLVIFSYTGLVFSQDTIDIPLKIKAGIELSGPAIWFADKQILNTEGYVSMDLNERRAVMFATGYVDYHYSQYNYSYNNKGLFIRTGFDFNLMKPKKAQGKYFTGIGLHYGLSRFTWDVPLFESENYWGTASSSIGRQTNWAHFVEATPGVRAEIFRNFSIGWTISLRMLLYSGAGKDQRPLYIPGFGYGGKTISTGMNYFMVWNIPYKRIKVIIKKEEPEETDEEAELNNTNNSIRP